MRFFFLCVLSLAACTGPEAPDQRAAVKTTGPRSAELRGSVQRLTSRRVEEAPAQGGYRVFKVQEGGSQVVVARTKDDGSVVTKCVESADDGFLGEQGGAEK